MFEGLLSPWHLAIIAFVAFVVLGPKKLADRWKALSDTVARLGDGDATESPPTTAEEPAPPPAAAPSLARRIGRRLTRRRRRSRRRSGGVSENS